VPDCQVKKRSKQPFHLILSSWYMGSAYSGLSNEKKMLEKLSKTQPIGRMGRPEEIGALVLYLCSNEASFVTGTDFPIDGGFVTLNN